jgi:hypothetical protein
MFHSCRPYNSKIELALDTCLRCPVEDEARPLGRCPAHCARAYCVSCYREQSLAPSYSHARLSELSLLFDIVLTLPTTVHQASLIRQISIGSNLNDFKVHKSDLRDQLWRQQPLPIGNDLTPALDVLEDEQASLDEAARVLDCLKLSLVHLLFSGSSVQAGCIN